MERERWNAEGAGCRESWVQRELGAEKAGGRESWRRCKKRECNAGCKPFCEEEKKHGKQTKPNKERKKQEAKCVCVCVCGDCKRPVVTAITTKNKRTKIWSRGERKGWGKRFGVLAGQKKKRKKKEKKSMQRWVLRVSRTCC